MQIAILPGRTSISVVGERFTLFASRFKVKSSIVLDRTATIPINLAFADRLKIEYADGANNTKLLVSCWTFLVMLNSSEE